MAVGRMRKRAEFLAARRGRRLNGPCFFIEARNRGDGTDPRVGLTVTKKVGNSVVRNRIRRRLREAIRLGAETEMVPGFDYVIVARREVRDMPFAALKDELSRRLARTKQPQGEPATAKRRDPERRSGSD